MAGGQTMSSQMTPQQQNMIGRQILLSSGIKMSQIVQQGFALNLGPVSQRIDLLRVGITTGIFLDFIASVDIAGGTGTPSTAGPWTILQQVTYTDFSGINRINTDGLSMWLLDSFKHAQLYQDAKASNELPGLISAVNTNLLSLPTTEGAAEILYCSIYVPIAYDPGSDLRGAVPSMTNIGQHYLTLIPASALLASQSAGGDITSAPYMGQGSGGSGISLNSLKVDVTQLYIQPQSIAPSQLPGIDLTTIYEINGRNITTSGFQSNAYQLINYPNDRSIMAAYHVFEDDSQLTLNEADMGIVELLINSNTVVRQMTPKRFRDFMRSLVQGDVPPSIYYWPHRQQPILTNLYATVQARYTLGTLNSNIASGVTKLTAQYESFYPSGQPLSGITPNAG
jgi:hypothetical protein